MLDINYKISQKRIYFADLSLFSSFFKNISLIIIYLLISLFFCNNSFALISANNKKDETKENTIFKADIIKGDRDKNIVTAIGNVEISNGDKITKSDKAVYNQNNGWIKINGDISLSDSEIGTLYSKSGQVKDDLTQGQFKDSSLIFIDGSYLKSSNIKKENVDVTSSEYSLLSICPNDEILQNPDQAGKKIDAISIKSRKTTIDKKAQRIKTKHGIVRIYNIPIFYSPYISFPTKQAKRKSGFLTPSYVNNSRFGFGIKTPYFVDVAENTNLILTPTIYDQGQVILRTDLKQLLKYGEHKSFVEIGNNQVGTETDREVINRTDKPLRYQIMSDGKYVFTHNSSLNHNIHIVGDRDYLRDYEFNFLPYTTSNINYDYVKNKTYLGVESIKFQELETQNPESEQIILPKIDFYAESKKSLFYKEKYAIHNNLTHIARESGLQYRRFSSTPEIKIPFNIEGNLIDLNAKFQWDYYSLEENNRFNENRLNYDSSFTNYKPEFSASWRLPLIQKLESNTLMLEPTISFSASTVKRKNFNDIPNEDSNNSELTVNNIFNSNRIAGYDRNEVGERISYGVKSSMFNKLGQFNLSIAQSYRFSDEEQDVVIRGFNDNNISNIVGQFSYIASKYFDINYLFQLNESNYSNEVNFISANFKYNKFRLSNDYLLLRRGVANSEKTAQNTIRFGYQFNKKFSFDTAIQKNLVTGRNLNRSATLTYGGCCVIFKFTTTEQDTANLTEKQRSHNLNIIIKGL